MSSLGIKALRNRKSKEELICKAVNIHVEVILSIPKLKKKTWGRVNSY